MKYFSKLIPSYLKTRVSKHKANQATLEIPARQVWYVPIMVVAALVVILHKAAAIDYHTFTAVWPTGSTCASYDDGGVFVHVEQGNRENGPFSVRDVNNIERMSGTCIDGVCTPNDNWNIFTTPGGAICEQPEIMFDTNVTTPGSPNTGSHILVRRVDITCPCAPSCDPCFFLGIPFLRKYATITLGTPDPQREHLKKNDKKVPECPDAEPMAHYSVHERLVSLNIEDTPFRYSPARGPAIRFTVTYNQKSRQQSSRPNYSNLGPKWNHNWLSFVNDDPNFEMSQISVYLPGGGTELYTLTGLQPSAPEQQSQAILRRTSPSSYERTMPDGSKLIYNAPDDANYYPRRVFMTEMKDPAGNSVLIGYDVRKRITTITDALQHVTHIDYYQNDRFKIKTVTEPFPLGRSATFYYDSNGRLQKIVDEIGIESEFHYIGVTDSIDWMKTPYGTTTFDSGGDDSNRWITITDPEGGREQVRYRASGGVPTETDPIPPGFTSAGLDVGNSFYWDKKATQGIAGNDFEDARARITHWAKYPDGSVSGIVASKKAPLERRVWFRYAGQSDTNHTGTSANPSEIARVLGDGTTQRSLHEYNSLGKMTLRTDPRDRVTAYIYDTNNIDLLEIRNQTGGINELVRKFESYILHKPQRIYDASGQFTQYQYNAYGQIESRTNPRLETTTFIYGGSVPDGYLRRITSPAVVAGSAYTDFTYDSAKRVQTITNVADGYTVTIGYDNIDRVTSLSYPDATTEQFYYAQIFPPMLSPREILDLTVSVDRMGRITERTYNGNRQITSITDPIRTTHFEWCRCGSLIEITDPWPNGPTTVFHRDLQSRLTQKEFDDGTTINYIYELQSGPDTPGATSRLESMTDALGRRTKYTYWADDNINTISYTNAQGSPLNPPTPSVSFTYDNYNRVDMMTDVWGPTVFHYYSPGTLGAGQLEYINGPLDNDQINFTYDELGRIHERSINSNLERIERDALGRITDTYNETEDPIPSLLHFVFNYQGVTPRLQTLHYPSPNNQTTSYNYNQADHDMRLYKLTNLMDGGGMLSEFGYEYDGAQDQIVRWSKLLGTTVSGLWFDYDNGKRLLSARNAFAEGAVTSKLEYNYDGAGNRTSDRAYNPQSYPGNGITRTYEINDSLNQIETLTVTGDVFADPQAFVYDAVGNLTDDGGGRTFEWDAANRLVAINYLSSGYRTEFAYDGLGRRVKITEYGAAVTAEIQPVSAEYTNFSTGKIMLPSGVCTITLQGLNPSGGENTMLVDAVTFDNVLVPNGSFETPSVNNYQVGPPSASWSFASSAGIGANGGTYGHPSTTEGSQAAFIRNHGSISQSFTINGGAHILRFKAAQLVGNENSQRLRVTFRTASSSDTTKRFVWCGNEICEERDETGAIVKKRFFGEYEERIGGIDAGVYFYTRDHFGSIREVTDSTGALVARYDYDPYGKRVVLDGTLPFDFGYTGHYYHAQSGLNLTLYRAYDPNLGRWISRDPIGETGGINLYAYTYNSPINLVDILGLDSWYDVALDWFFERGTAHRYYNASHQVTRDLMMDTGVQEALVAWNAKGRPNSPFTYNYYFGPDDYFRELSELDGTGSFLGSYDVTITRCPDGSLGFRVDNPTGWESGTRSPIRSAKKNPSIEDMFNGGPYTVNPRSILNDRPRSAPGPGGNFTQTYYWNIR